MLNLPRDSYKGVRLFLGEPEDCMNRGHCSRENDKSVCRCNSGFDGEDCSILICAGEPMCSDHGKQTFNKS